MRRSKAGVRIVRLQRRHGRPHDRPRRLLRRRAGPRRALPGAGRHRALGRIVPTGSPRSRRARGGASTRSAPRCRGSTRRRTGSRSSARSNGPSRTRSPICAAFRGRRRSPTSTASRAGALHDVRWAGCASGTCSPGRSAPVGPGAPLRPREVPYDDTLTLAQALRRRRDARPRHGRRAAEPPARRPARVVMPQMYGYKSVKWVSRIEVPAPRHRRLLGAARLRRGRLGRCLELP